jgi:hypothetical protein
MGQQLTPGLPGGGIVSWIGGNGVFQELSGDSCAGGKVGVKDWTFLQEGSDESVNLQATAVHPSKRATP